MTNSDVRDKLIQGVWNRINLNTTIGAFMDLYDNTGAGTINVNGTAG